MSRIHIYYPGDSFPSVSVTGSACSLNCRHCNAHYLKGMRPVETPEKLLAFALNLHEKGGKGFLISGGSDPQGKVPLGRFAPAIRKIKKETGLIINAHIGFAERKEIEELVEAGTDVFSVDVVGDRTTVREVYGLKKGPEDYRKLLQDLEDAGTVIVPHITAGLHFGEIHGEFGAVDLLTEFNHRAIVFLSLIPTKGTGMEEVQEVPPEDMLNLLGYALEKLNGDILIGCMRPRKRREWEKDAVDLGIHGIVLPSGETLEYLNEKGKKIEVHHHCCALRAIGL